MKVNTPILCYDNQCILCSKLMQTYIKLEESSNLVFTPIGSELYKSIVQNNQDIDSILLVNQSGISIKSDAVFQLVKRLKSPYIMLKVFWILPKILRDYLYDSLAKRRYTLFGKEEDVCKLGMMDSSRIILSKNQYLDYSQRLGNPNHND